MADERRQQREAATVAATSLYADPRQSAPAAELRAQLESQTGQSKGFHLANYFFKHGLTDGLMHTFKVVANMSIFKGLPGAFLVIESDCKLS